MCLTFGESTSKRLMKPYCEDLTQESWETVHPFPHSAFLLNSSLTATLQECTEQLKYLHNNVNLCFQNRTLESEDHTCFNCYYWQHNAEQQFFFWNNIFITYFPLFFFAAISDFHSISHFFQFYNLDGLQILSMGNTIPA